MTPPKTPAPRATVIKRVRMSVAGCALLTRSANPAGSRTSCSRTDVSEARSIDGVFDTLTVGKGGSASGTLEATDVIMLATSHQARCTPDCDHQAHTECECKKCPDRS